MGSDDSGMETILDGDDEEEEIHAEQKQGQFLPSRRWCVS